MFHNVTLSPKIQGILWMCLSAFAASFMLVLVRQASITMPTSMIVFFRNFTSFVMLLPFIPYKSLGLLRTNRMKMYLTRACMGLCTMTMWFYAISIVPLPLATSLSFTSPLFTALLAVIIYKEKTGMHRWMALIVGFIGTLIILRPGTAHFSLTSLFVIATSCLWALSGIIIKSLTKTERPILVVFYMVLFMTPLSLPLALYDWHWPNETQWLLLTALGFVAIIQQLSLTYAIASADLTVILPYDFSRLVFVTMLSYILFGEMIDVPTALGAALIMGGAIFATMHESRKDKRAAAKAL